MGEVGLTIPPSLLLRADEVGPTNGGRSPGLLRPGRRFPLTGQHPGTST